MTALIVHRDLHRNLKRPQQITPYLLREALRIFVPRIFKNVHIFAKAASNLGYGGITRNLFGSQINQWIPETGSAYGKADETWHSSRRSQPFVHFFVALSPSEDDAAHIVASVAVGYGHDILAILTSVEPLDLPDVWFHLRILKLLYGLDHQSGTYLQVVSLPVLIDLT